MVVAASRLHAVRYAQALRSYCANKGYDIGVLVAFSGTVLPDVEDHTESSLNGIPESQTATQFATDSWHVLVVAEKYQTGFDQPLLYAMYVDKTLSGLAAVQTLSRLNRVCDGKDGTFVLDFRNEADATRESFAPWYTSTVAPPTDPNLLYDTRHQLDRFGVLWREDVQRVVALLVQRSKSHGRIHAALAPSIDRFTALDSEDQAEFRDALARFIRTYSFLSQVVSFTDAQLEGEYRFCKALAMFVRSPGDAGVDIGNEVELTHLRTEKTFTGSISLDDGDGEVSTVFSGTGIHSKAEAEPLSVIIARLNERFGTDWSESDIVHLRSVAEEVARREDVWGPAAANTPENFKLFIKKIFVDQIMEQMQRSEVLSLKLLQDNEALDAVLDLLLPSIQAKATVAWQEHCPIGDLLGTDKEGKHLEYKATLRVHAGGEQSGKVYKPLEGAVLKTIAAFANNREGGTLLIGVANDATVHGIEQDYDSLRKPGTDVRDLFNLHLGQIVTTSMGGAVAANLNAQIHTIDDCDICRVQVYPSGVPVDATVTVDKSGKISKKTAFFVRTINGTRELDEDEKQKYIQSRWRIGPSL